jgi:predicted permease
MTNFILIALCIAAGMIFRRLKTLPKDAHKGINAWILYIALPAVSFKYLPHITWSKELFLPALAPVVVWIGAWVFMKLYTYKKQMDKPTNGILKIMSGLGNTSFVGFPLIMAYFSEKEISIAIICDQVSFLLLSTVGLITVLRATGETEVSTKIILKKLFLFPPFLGCIAALSIPHIMDISTLQPLFDKLAGTVGPLALFSVGLQLQFTGWRDELKHLSVVLFYKLLIAPVLVLLIAIVFRFKGSIPQISIFESAMPTLLTASVLADEYQMNPKLANLIIGISIALSFITTGLWWLLLTKSGLF